MKGPIAVLGANGFIGKNLVKYLRQTRDDVLEAGKNNLWGILSEKPQTVFNLISYGSHSWQDDVTQIYFTNFILTQQILQYLENQGFSSYVHAGSSAEYGFRSYGVTEYQNTEPNTHYAVTKACCSNLLWYLGKYKKLPVSHLRLYAVYGPHDHPKKLIPQLIEKGMNGEFPPYLKMRINRDFIYVDDVCEAFVKAATRLEPRNYGEAFNVGTEIDTPMRKLAETIKDIFHIKADPVFTGDITEWDCLESRANMEKTSLLLNFTAKTSLKDGLIKTMEWTKNEKHISR